MYAENNATADDVFEMVIDHPDRWSYYEKLNPKLRIALQNSPVDFSIYDIWKCQVAYGVKETLQSIHTEASRLTICDVLPLGVDEKWVVK